jgi:proline dehydrogenase
MVRSVLLYLSTQKQLRRWMETSSLSRPLTSRFIAGLTLDEAIVVCHRLNRECLLVTLDHLGESVTSLEEARASRDAYLAALRRLNAENLPASVSLKLTQFGLDLSEEACRENVEAVVRCAKEEGRSVEIDMEASSYVDITLRIVRDLHARYGSVRAVIQSYLRRSEADVERLCEERIPVRLCKGAYKEPPEIAFEHKKEVDANYIHLSKILLERGEYPALATHDPKMIGAALDFMRQRRLPREAFEFQMLYGIRRDLQRRLTAEGFRLRLYVPYGVAWYPYFMRRLAERPANLLFLLRNLMRR